jgi:hypothetical protein
MTQKSVNHRRLHELYSYIANLAYTAAMFHVLDTAVIRSMDHTLWPENPWLFFESRLVT